jgi:adenylate cyclase
MFADIAGHGPHSEADEKSARAYFLAELREVFEPRIAEHSGRLIRDMGDGLQVEFRNGVDALRCAIDIQRAKAQQGAEAPDQRLSFRIAVHLGDVIVDVSPAADCSDVQVSRSMIE